MICETSFVSVLCGEPPGSASRFDFQAARLPAWSDTITTEALLTKHRMRVFWFWEFSFLLLASLALAAPGEDRPIWGGGGVDKDKDKVVELDQRSTSQDEDPLSVRRGLVNRWKTWPAVFFFESKLALMICQASAAERLFIKSLIVATIHWAMWTLTTGKTGRAGEKTLLYSL